MNDDVKNQAEENQQITEDIISRNAKLLDGEKQALSKGEKKYLEYFWNSKTHDIRKSIPENIISFFESELSHEFTVPIIAQRVRVDMMRLGMKGYVETVRGTNPTEYKLTSLGISFMKDAHPRLIVIAERFWERTPALVRLLVALIGLIASIFGIIQFFRDY